MWESVLFGEKKYVRKYFLFINTGKFKKLDKYPTVTTQAKIQGSLRKMKSRFTQQEYKKRYPTGSNSRKCYGTAKVQKLLELETIEQLPLPPIVSNAGTAK